MEDKSTGLRSAFGLIPLVLTFLSLAAHAEEWMSVWTPPKSASGGMESFVDATSIKVSPDVRRAKWRMVRWVSEAFRDKSPLLPNVVSYVIVVSTFDCSKELMRDEQTTMYLADGTNNAGAIKSGNWGKPAGATRAVFDFVCRATP
jgi:hypothetical protein